MKLIRGIILIGLGILSSLQSLHTQPANFSKTQAQLDNATDLQVMLEALASVKPVAFDSLPKNKRGQVVSTGF